MEISGTIKVINPTQEVSSSFKKRELVVTTDETYPQHIMIEFAQDKCGVLDSYQVGQAVKVSINLRGREWINPQGEAKYFNQIQGWRIEKADSAPSFQAQPEQPTYAAQASEQDDLPF